MFAAGGAASIVIALITISFQGLKAAQANPVESLRSNPEGMKLFWKMKFAKGEITP